MKRAGTVRVMTYTQLSRRPDNGDGFIPQRPPRHRHQRDAGTLAADSALNAAPAAVLGDNQAALARIPAHMPPSIPSMRRRVGGVRRGRRGRAARSERRRGARAPRRPAAHRRDRRRARGGDGGWAPRNPCSRRGSVHRSAERARRQCAGGVPDFYTPERRRGFSFSLRSNQAWLLEVPPPQPWSRGPRIVPSASAPPPPAGRRCSRTCRRSMTAFGLPVTGAEVAATLKERWRRRAGWVIRSRRSMRGTRSRPFHRANLTCATADADARMARCCICDALRRRRARRSSCARKCGRRTTWPSPCILTRRWSGHHVRQQRHRGSRRRARGEASR